MLKRSALILAVAALAVAAQAQNKKMVTAPHCPACKMALATSKSDHTPVGIKVGKKVMYCCAGCDMKTWAKDKKGNLIPPADKPKPK